VNAVHNLALVYKQQKKTSLYVETYKKSQRMAYLHRRQSARLPLEEKHQPRRLSLNFLLWGLAAGVIIILILILLGYW